MERCYQDVPHGKKMHGRLIRLINTIIMGAVIIKEIAIHIYSIIRNIGEIRELFLITPARYVQARYTRETLIEAVEADAKQMHKDIMLIDSPEDLPSDAILVVAKVSSDGDYHFAAQLGNGDWVDKPGTGESRYNAIDGFASAWTINASSGKIVYDSAPIYFAYYR